MGLIVHSFKANLGCEGPEEEYVKPLSLPPVPRMLPHGGPWTLLFRCFSLTVPLKTQLSPGNFSGFHHWADSSGDSWTQGVRPWRRPCPERASVGPQATLPAQPLPMHGPLPLTSFPNQVSG